MAMYTSRNPLAALLDYATSRGNEAASIGSVMSQLASPILKSQGVQVDDAVQRGPVPKPTLVSTAPPVPPAPVVPLPKTTSNAEEYYIREYQKRGLARPVAEGIVASMNSESGLDPTINEKNPVVAGSRGGFGLAQWTGPRRIAFERWASDNGKDVNDAQAQVDFTMSEFAGPERKAYDALIQSPDAQSAAATFTNQFLRPGVPNMEARVNDAARMSGQPYNPAIAASAGPTAAGIGIGGPMPQTVEGILSTLYPDGSADEKKAHRKDILMGLSQGLSALSQGRPVDLSNIAANADQRRRQYVLDTREKEKAKAAASLVYSQTGDANMAAGIASGAINYSDVLNERQMKRAEQTAQDARLKDAATTDALTAAMRAGKMPQETIDLVQKGGVDALNAYQKIQADQHLLEQEAKTKDQEAQNVADAQYILSTAAKDSPQARAAERVIALGGSEDVYALLKERAPPAGAAIPDQIEYADALVAGGKYPDRATALQALLANGGNGAGGTANMQDAQALVNSGAVNAATNKPYTLAEAMAATVLPPSGAAAPSVTYNSDGTITINPAATGGVPAAGGAPAVTGGAPAVTGGAPAGTVGGAFSTTFGSVNDAAKAALLPGDIAQQAATLGATEASTAATEQATTQDTAEAPLDFATLQADLALKQQDLEAKKTAAPTVEAKAALDVEAADIANSQAALNFKIAQSSQFVDAKTKETALAAAELQVKTAKKAYDDAVATSEQAKVDAQKQSTDSYVNADKQFAVFEDSAKEVMAHGLESMTTGLLGQVVGKVGSYVVDQTPRSDFLAKVGTMGSQLMMGALRDAKAAGVTLTPVTDTDLQVLGKSNSLLSDPAPLSGETIVKETAFQTNYMKDALYGPKDLTRYDEFGQPYKVGLSTLGVTEDTFARHWLNVPPAIKEAWRTGKITTLPTNDPNYAEAAKVINALEGNFKLYQPDVVVDRSIVGIPAPEGVSVEDWPSVWAGLSDKAKAELTKAAK